jgi:hypothetical protein
MRTISARALAACVLLASAAGAAHAQSSCSGTYAATLIHALPQPNVVALEVFDNSPDNLRLGSKFSDGLRQAGVRLDGAPTSRLRLNISFLDPSGGLGGGIGGSSPSERSDWSAMGGGVYQALPDMPSRGILPRRGAANGNGPPQLVVRAELTDPDTHPVAWVLSLQCALNTDDRERLAFDLGVLIGNALGKTVARGAI